MIQSRALAAASGLLAPLILAAGCDERQTTQPPTAAAPAAVATAPPAPARAAPAAAPAPPPGPTWTLMVTWMSPQQPPATTQTLFHDAGACEKARQAALAEGARLQTLAQTDADAAQAKYQGGARRYVGRTLLAGAPEPTPQVAPTVAAFCAAS